MSHMVSSRTISDGITQILVAALVMSTCNVTLHTSCFAEDDQFSAETERSGNSSADEISIIVETLRKRQTRFKSVRIDWVPDRSGIHRWSTYQTTWVNPDKREHVVPHDTLWIVGDKFKYQTVRWYYRFEREFGGFNGSMDDPEHYFPLHAPSNQTSINSFLSAIGEELADPSAQYRRPRQFTRTYDGSVYRELFSAADEAPPESAIYADAGGKWPEDIVYRPLLLAFRPLSSLTPAIEPGRCQLEDETSYVNGRDCRLLRETREDGIVRLYWLDPQREYVVVRQIEQHDEQPAAQSDIDYREDPEHGWLPSSWTSILMKGTAPVENYPGRDEVFQFVRVNVTDLAINDEGTSQESLVLAFPEGTVVNDGVRHQTYLFGQQGSEAPLTRDDLLKLRDGSSDRFWHRLSIREWALLVGVGLILSAVVLRTLRSRTPGGENLESD